jgi:hypothetical protein
MKRIKYFENIDWESLDWEEEPELKEIEFVDSKDYINDYIDVKIDTCVYINYMNDFRNSFADLMTKIFNKVTGKKTSKDRPNFISLLTEIGKKDLDRLFPGGVENQLGEGADDLEGMSKSYFFKILGHLCVYNYDHRGAKLELETHLNEEEFADIMEIIMRYLYDNVDYPYFLFENMDIDPFGEEDWEEQETHTMNIYRLKIGYPNHFLLEKLEHRGLRLYNSENKRIDLPDTKVEKLLKGKFDVEYVTSIRYLAYIFFSMKERKIRKDDLGILKDICEKIIKDFTTSKGRKIATSISSLISDDPNGLNSNRLKIKLSDLTNHLTGLKKNNMDYKALEKEFSRFIKGGDMPPPARRRRNHRIDPLGGGRFFFNPYQNPIDEGKENIDPFGEEDWDEEEKKEIKPGDLVEIQDNLSHEARRHYSILPGEIYKVEAIRVIGRFGQPYYYLGTSRTNPLKYVILSNDVIKKI